MRSRISFALHVVALLALAATARAQSQWQLVEDLRIGGDASEATIFTDIRGVVEGAQGQIFVLDSRPQEIRLFDRTGKFVARIARKGQGPGEIVGGNGMLLLRDTIWVSDPNNGRWSAWSAHDGKYVGQVKVPINSYGFIWDAGLDASGRILDPVSVPGTRTGPDGRPVYERRLRRVSTDGRIIDTIPMADCVQRNPPVKSTFRGSGMGPRGPGGTTMSIPFLPRPLVVMDGKGGVWCTPNDEYLLVHRSVEKADTLHAIRQRYTRIPVPRAERDAEVERVRKALTQYSVVDADYSLIPSLHPVFVRLDADDRGRLWARRTASPGAPHQFDVYDTNGRAVATVTTTIPFARYVPLHFRGDHVYGVAEDADGVPHVVRARIIRPR